MQFSSSLFFSFITMEREREPRLMLAIHRCLRYIDTYFLFYYKLIRHGIKQRINDLFIWWKWQKGRKMKNKRKYKLGKKQNKNTRAYTEIHIMYIIQKTFVIMDTIVMFPLSRGERVELFPKPDLSKPEQSMNRVNKSETRPDSIRTRLIGHPYTT